MANYERTDSDFPVIDRAGDPITADNPLELPDMLVRELELSDPVVVVAGSVRDAPADGPWDWAGLGLFLRDIFLDEKTEVLRSDIEAELARLQGLLNNLTVDIPQASVTQAGGAQLANVFEGRGGTDSEKIMTSLRLLDGFRNGDAFRSTTFRKGVENLIDQYSSSHPGDVIVTPAYVLDFFENYVQTFPLSGTIVDAGGGLFHIMSVATSFSLTDSVVDRVRTSSTPVQIRFSISFMGTYGGGTSDGYIRVSWPSYSSDRANIVSVNGGSNTSGIVFESSSLESGYLEVVFTNAPAAAGVDLTFSISVDF